jgi:sigma-B regulation protein RsbU (phosphoserine phosphatase)
LIDGEIVAVLMIEILPTTISNEFVITRGTNCYAFIVSATGNISAREDMNTKILVWDLTNKEKEEFRKAFAKIIPGGQGSFFTEFRGDRLDVAYCAMTPGKFVIGVAAPRRQAEEKASKAMSHIEKQKEQYVISAGEYIDGKIILYLGIGVLVSIGMLLVAAGVAVRIGKPISQLEAGVKQLSKRKLNERIELKSYDEFQDLGDTFNAMAVELGNQIKNLRENIAHQERARHELAVAAEIQKEMLPDASLTFPECDEFDIYAEMHPAREVGGDFYDFFLIDEKHLFFTVGDISGKGLSAALFMMRTLTLLRHEAEDGLPPDEIFVNVGNELYHNNDSCMFFTASCGILDISNGEVVLCNAGHPMPYLRHEHSFEPVDMDTGIVVGPMPLSKEQFKVKKLVLTKGDTLFLYTDGIIEAFNNKNVEFQSKRLHASLQKLTGANPREVLDGVARNVRDFIDGAPQSDDITMLTVKYYS